MSEIALALTWASPGTARHVAILRWKARDMLRTLAWRMYTEPLPSFTGWMFLGTAVIAWTLALTVFHGRILAGFCAAAGLMYMITGTVLLAVGAVIKWHRGW